MARTKLYLDKRSPRPDGSCSLKIAISHKRQTRHISLMLYLKPNEFNDRLGLVTTRADKNKLNNLLAQRKHEIDAFILQLEHSSQLDDLNCNELKQKIINYLKPLNEKNKEHLLVTAFEKVISLKKGTTKANYLYTLKLLREFTQGNIDNMMFEDITKDFLLQFDSYLERQCSIKRNSRNLILGKLRAVFNYAIDEEITSAYPFRKIKFKREPTMKRSLSVEELRKLASAELPPRLVEARDIFMLTFYLRGINTKDLCNLSEISNGYIQYRRSKTGVLYNIKIEKEAKEIIEKYKGKKYLLYMLDKYKEHISYLIKINTHLKKIAKILGLSASNFSTYWARHSWASIASELDIPDDIISRSLGHSGVTGARVTDVYISFNHKKVDAANRKVIDYVLYNKKD